jgi:hypothetical protein
VQGDQDAGHVVRAVGAAGQVMAREQAFRRGCAVIVRIVSL